MKLDGVVYSVIGLNKRILTQCTFFYKKNLYKKMGLKTSSNLEKMLRKSPASNAWAAFFKNADFS